MLDYMQTNDLDHASKEEQEEYDRYIEALEAIYDMDVAFINDITDVPVLDEVNTSHSPDVDMNPDDEEYEH